MSASPRRPARVQLQGERDLWQEVEAELRAAALAGERGRGARAWGGLRVRYKFSPLAGRARARHALRRWLLARPAPRLAEFENLAWLRAQGFAAPRPLLAGALVSHGAASFQFLYTEEIPGARTLREACAERGSREREELARALGREVARLHALGFVHRDLYPRNVLLQPGETRPWFVDAWRAGARRGLRGPSWDLGALALFAPVLLERHEERSLFEAYFDERARHGSIDRAALLRRTARDRRRHLARLRGRPSPEAPLVAPPTWSPPVAY